MPRLQITRARTNAELNALSTPGAGGENEAIQWTWYDTQTYTDNSTTQLRFFTTQSSDRSITNLDIAGQLPYFFELHFITLDVVPTAATAFVTTAAGGVGGILDDLGMILVSGRGRYTMSINSKPYGPFPLQQLHGTGGPNGGGWGTFTAEESLQFGVNSVPDGSFLQFNGSKIIRPNQPFNVVVDWPAALNLTADYRLRMGLHGVSYQPVS
jgi:hypothetical protein